LVEPAGVPPHKIWNRERASLGVVEMTEETHGVHVFMECGNHFLLGRGNIGHIEYYQELVIIAEPECQRTDS